MKWFALLLCMAGCATPPVVSLAHVVYAQDVPHETKVIWDPSANAVGYLVTLDTDNPITVLASTCTAECSVKLPVAAFGMHTYAVTAFNRSGDGITQVTSQPAVLTFELRRGTK